MQNVHEIPNKILDAIKRRGPSLPIQLAKDVGVSSLFISAFLSELSDNRKVRISSLKVGGSPLYYVEGQEADIEKFHTYMHPKEIEAFELLKKNLVLKDSDLEPAIRVAIKSIKDFAESFRKDDQLYWKLNITPRSEIEKFFSPTKGETFIVEKTETKQDSIKNDLNNKKPEIIEILKKEIEEIKPEQKNISGILAEKEEEEEEIEKPIVEQFQEKKKQVIEKQKIESEKSKNPLIEKMNEKFKEMNLFNNPLVQKQVEKPKKEKQKSEFILNTIRFLEKNNFKILEEKDYKAKEYFCIAEVETNLGPIAFLTIAKEKKSVSDEDLHKLLSEAQSIPLPALYLSTGELNKKAKEYIEKYYSILKFKKII